MITPPQKNLKIEKSKFLTYEITRRLAMTSRRNDLFRKNNVFERDCQRLNAKIIFKNYFYNDFSSLGTHNRTTKNL